MEQEIKEIEVFSSSNEYEINQVCSILSDNNIPFIRKDYGSGSYMNIYFGQSIQDKKIFVNEDSSEKAVELIETIFSSTASEKINIQELEEGEEDYDSDKKYKWARYLMFFLILGIPCITLIIIFLLSVFQK